MYILTNLFLWLICLGVSIGGIIYAGHDNMLHRYMKYAIVIVSALLFSVSVSGLLYTAFILIRGLAFGVWSI